MKDGSEFVADDCEKIEKINLVATKSSQGDIEELILTHRVSGRKLARTLLRGWQVTIPVEEVNSIVDLTLCEAARRFLDNRGASFMTFFFYHLRGNLVRTITRMAKNSKYIVHLTSSGLIDLSVSTGDELPQLVFQMKEGAGSGVGSEVPEELMLRKERIELCRTAWSSLDDLEREVLLRLYSDEDSLVDIAAALGYSRCHISRVKKRSLQRLRELYLLLQKEEDLPEFDSDSIEEETLQDARSYRSRRGRRRRGLPAHVTRRHSAFAQGRNERVRRRA